MQVYEKYQQLARDAASSGDRIAAENLLQHAEHYYRLMVAAGMRANENRDVDDNGERDGNDRRFHGERGGDRGYDSQQSHQGDNRDSGDSDDDDETQVDDNRREARANDRRPDERRSDDRSDDSDPDDGDRRERRANGGEPRAAQNGDGEASERPPRRRRSRRPSAEASGADGGEDAAAAVEPTQA